MRTLALALSAALFAALPAVAQDQPPRLEVDERADEDFAASHLAAAQRVIDLTGSDQVFDAILPKLAEQTQQLFTRTNPALTREIEETVMETALEMAPRRVDLSRTIQLIWARRFSEEELTELASFFASDLGGKYIEFTPVVTALSVGAGRQWEQRLAAEMVRTARAKLREKGYSL